MKRNKENIALDRREVTDGKLSMYKLFKNQM